MMAERAAACNRFLKDPVMAIGWLTVLKLVPWTDVISNAPVVADGAKKLWNAVAKKAPVAGSDAGFAPGSPLDPLNAPSLETLQVQLAATQATVTDLRGQMLASSELIKALAEQNAQLIKRVDVNRTRLLWLAMFTLAMALYLVATRF